MPDVCGMMKSVMLTLAEASQNGLQRMLRRFGVATIRFFAVAQNDRKDNRYSVAVLLTLTLGMT